MSTETNWQTARPTIRERAKFMLNNDRLSDVKFVAANSNGETESKQVIPAHKFILAIGSPVFEAMFYGELAETKDTIELPDCDNESLLELFRYLYSDEVNLSGSNVMGVLYLAKKYMVPSLTDKCKEYLKEKLDPSNVFIILPFVQKYEHKTLEDRCWNVIDKQTETAVKSEGFETIERSLLEAIVARDSLTIKEVALFKAVDGWATKQCKKQSLAAEQAVCVTTHKGSWVNLLLCLISIVTRSSSHLVREINQTQRSKHCCLFPKTLRKRTISRIFKIS